jgi:hypothetical protein
MKIRTEHIANRKPTDDEAYFLAVHKALKGEAGALRFQAGEKKERGPAPKEASVPNEEKRKGSPVKK